MQLMEARPPYIRFETRAVTRQRPSTEGGGIYYIDKDYVLITPHGSKDCIEKVAEEYFPYLREQVRQQMFDPRWLEAYEAAYRAWKTDQPMPVTGTPIRNWPAATPAEVKTLLGNGVLAVEDLAQANEEMLARLGMGARGLKQRAQDWVTANTNTAPLVAQLEAMRQTMAGLQSRLDGVLMENQRLAGALAERNQEMATYAQSGQSLPATYSSLAGSRAATAQAQESKLIDSVLEEELR